MARGIHLITEDEIQPRKWDIAVEATGSPDGFDLARRAIRPHGTILLKSTYKGDITLTFLPLLWMRLRCLAHVADLLNLPYVCWKVV